MSYKECWNESEHRTTLTLTVPAESGGNVVWGQQSLPGTEQWWSEVCWHSWERLHWRSYSAISHHDGLSRTKQWYTSLEPSPQGEHMKGCAGLDRPQQAPEALHGKGLAGRPLEPGARPLGHVAQTFWTDLDGSLPSHASCAGACWSSFADPSDQTRSCVTLP